jgi:hypothetical protein
MAQAKKKTKAQDNKKPATKTRTAKAPMRQAAPRAGGPVTLEQAKALVRARTPRHALCSQRGPLPAAAAAGVFSCAANTQSRCVVAHAAAATARLVLAETRFFVCAKTITVDSRRPIHFKSSSAEKPRSVIANYVGFSLEPGDRVKRRFQRRSSALGLLSSAEDALKRRVTKSVKFRKEIVEFCQDLI